MQSVLFNPYRGPYQVLSFRVRVDLEAMAMTGCSAFPNAPALLETSRSDCLVSYLGHTLRVGSYPSAEVDSVYSTAPVDWAMCVYVYVHIYIKHIYKRMDEYALIDTYTCIKVCELISVWYDDPIGKKLTVTKRC